MRWPHASSASLPPSKILARASQVGSFIHPPRLISSPLTSFLVRFCYPVWISFLKRMRFFDLDGRNSISVVLRTLDWTSGKQDGMGNFECNKGMFRAVGELDCSGAHIRLKQPGKSEDKVECKATDSRAMGTTAPWYRTCGTSMELPILCSHEGRALGHERDRGATKCNWEPRGMLQLEQKIEDSAKTRRCSVRKGFDKGPQFSLWHLEEVRRRQSLKDRYLPVLGIGTPRPETTTGDASVSIKKVEFTKRGPLGSSKESFGSTEGTPLTELLFF
ncbi:hypothetical protein B296_00039886 [Ensete ventricosum]|uniref:Uncharacterized protein n=1 Tax=Ensete ventricosum TaxID=4639 RepID=A0A426ZFH9_ENSVE|nr:hypothetical protein B296_00039886 [Ensete ventricosum]